MLSLPLWKWVSLVESWAWSATEEGKRSELERELDRSVDFRWLSDSSNAGDVTKSDPWRWQKNTKGESLLSSHRKRKAGE